MADNIRATRYQGLTDLQLLQEAQDAISNDLLRNKSFLQDHRPILSDKAVFDLEESIKEGQALLEETSRRLCVGH